MHLRRQLRIHCIVNIFVKNLRQKTGTRIVPVHALRKHRQRAQVNSVAVLQYIKSIVTERHTQNIADTRPVARRRAHPRNIMIAPLDIHIMEMHQFLQNDIRSRTTVKYIAQDMKIIDRQTPDQAADHDNKAVRHPDVNQGIDKFAVILRLIVIGIIDI